MGTLKMKVEQTTKQTKEVEVKLPYYSKSPCYLYKVLGVNEAIEITLLDTINHFGISTTSTASAFREGVEPCTEREFEDAFDMALDKLVAAAEKSKTLKTA